MRTQFILYPAIDLRRGQVVRLKEGDPLRQTQFSDNPAETAQRWLDAGAVWLHVINLDGAFGEEESPNLLAVQAILDAAQPYNARIQLGGGLRDLEGIQKVLDLGVERAILGTLAVKDPDALAAALLRWGNERIAVSLDARGEVVQTHGWQENSHLNLFTMAAQLKGQGLRHLVYTDISRDGMQTGFNLETTVQLAQQSGLQVIASGGVRSPEDIAAAQANGLAGIILGRALYEGQINLADALGKYQSK